VSLVAQNPFIQLSGIVVPQSEASKAKQRARMKAWRARNRDSVQAYQKAWREANKEEIKAYQSAYHLSYRKRDDVQTATRKRHLKNYYRMTEAQFNELWAQQDGKCGVCSVEMLPKGRHGHSVAIDHNHETGAVRGLLCRGCNNGIGCLQDSPEILKAAAQYLSERGHYGSLFTKELKS